MRGKSLRALAPSLQHISQRADAYSQRMGIFSHFMNLHAVYLKWGWLQISVSNLVIILGMLILFVLAMVVPFPKDHHSEEAEK